MTTNREEALELLRHLKSRGVKVLAPRCDIAVAEELGNTLTEVSSRMPPIKGCVQATMVLRVSPCLIDLGRLLD